MMQADMMRAKVHRRPSQNVSGRQSHPRSVALHAQKAYPDVNAPNIANSFGLTIRQRQYNRQIIDICYLSRVRIRTGHRMNSHAMARAMARSIFALRAGGSWPRSESG